MATKRLLVCSVGNPGSTYRNTRHSAGHSVIELVREALHYPQFSTDGRYGGLLSQPPFGGGGAYTLFQSPSLMNISGKPIKTAWRAFLSDLDSDEREHALLVILHDELEKQIGEVKLKKTGSPAGHNGLISIISQLQTKDFHRLGIGIGRPESRDSNVVAKYVLSKFTSFEKEKLEGQSLDKVLEHLRQLSKLA